MNSATMVFAVSNNLKLTETDLLGLANIVYSESQQYMPSAYKQ